MEKLCGCGCGEVVKNKFVLYHQSRGRKLSEEAKQNLRQKNLGKVIPQEVREKISKNNAKGFLGKTHSEETRKKLSTYASTRTRRPHSEETKMKMSLASKGKPKSKEHKEKLSDAAKVRQSQPCSEETKQKISRANRENWANGVYDNFPLNYSSYEVKIAPVLEQLGFKATYKDKFYIRKGSRVRIPDFVNTSTKEVIELFGTYWHRDQVLPEGQRHETPEEYIEWYKEVGYTCSVVWIEEEFEEFYQRKLEEVDGKKRCN